MPQLKCHRLICEVEPQVGEEIKKRAKEFEITIRDYIYESVTYRMYLEDTGQLMPRTKD